MIDVARSPADLVWMNLSGPEIRRLYARVEARQLLPGDEEIIAAVIRDFITEVEAGRASLEDLFSEPSSAAVIDRAERSSNPVGRAD